VVVEENKRLAESLPLSARHRFQLLRKRRDLVLRVEIVVTLPCLRMAPPLLAVSPVEAKIKEARLQIEYMVLRG
jgi:hypothetical protein